MNRETLTYTVRQEDCIHSIYQILRRSLGASARVIRACRNEGDILKNGLHTRTVDRVETGDVLTLVLPKTQPAADLQPETMPLQILYEDEDFLAVLKPAGIPVHPSKGHPYGTLLNGIVGLMEERVRMQGSSERFEPHLINRLDQGTAGIVLIGKHPFVQEALARMGHGKAEDGGVEKVYRLTTFGVPEPPEGIVDAPIGQPDRESVRRAVWEGGYPSQTAYRVLRVYPADRSEAAEAPMLADVECRLLTGRTHQIRVHMAHIGCPIVGDPLYGTPASLQYAKEKGLTHQTLVACALRFRHPVTGQMVAISLPESAY